MGQHLGVSQLWQRRERSLCPSDYEDGGGQEKGVAATSVPHQQTVCEWQPGTSAFGTLLQRT